MYDLLRNLIDPITMAFLLLGAALAFAWWKNPEARKSLTLSVLVFVLGWLACTGVVAFLATGALEWRYPPLVEMPADAEAIVVLSGGAKPATEYVPYARPACDTLRRCHAAARLYRTRRCPVICSGGPVRDTDNNETLADLMRGILIEMGVAADDIHLEDASTSTYTNAAQVKRVLDANNLHHVVLVTDATHLYRAELCFVKQGVDVIPAGAHYEAERFGARLTDFVPHTGSAKKSNIALHEAVGLLWYKMKGRL